MSSTSAKQAGDASPLTGSYGKFFDFVYNFLRLANGLRGRGFQTVEDVFTRAGRGRTGQQLQGRALSLALEVTGQAEQSMVMPIRRTNVVQQERMGVTEVGPGGNFVEFTIEKGRGLVGGKDLTGQTFTAANVEIDPETGRQSMEVSDVPAELAKQEDLGVKKSGYAVNLLNPNNHQEKVHYGTGLTGTTLRHQFTSLYPSSTHPISAKRTVGVRRLRCLAETTPIRYGQKWMAQPN